MTHTAILLLALLQAGQDPDPRQKKEIEALVERLGHRDYRVREQAGVRLLEIGPDASDAIKAGQLSADGEISERCRKLYPLLWTMGLDKRLRAFVQSPNLKDADELPFVKKWLEITGDTKASRELYANMARGHSRELKTAEEHPERIPALLGEFAKSIYVQSAGATAARASALASEPDVTFFLFLGAVGEVRRTSLPGVSSPHYYQFLNADWTTRSLGGDKPSKEVRLLYARWLEKERYTTVMRRAIEIARQHKVAECGPAVLKIAKDVNAIPYVRATALTGFAFIGSRENVKDLEPFLTDKVLVANVVRNNTRTSVQLRDVALVASILIAGQSPKDFGLEQDSAMRAGGGMITYSTHCFPDDDKREAGHQKWKEWSRENLGKK